MWGNEPSPLPGPAPHNESCNPPPGTSRCVPELDNVMDFLITDVLYELRREKISKRVKSEKRGWLVIRKTYGHAALRETSRSKPLSPVTLLKFGATQQQLPTGTAAVPMGRGGRLTLAELLSRTGPLQTRLLCSLRSARWDPPSPHQRKRFPLADGKVPLPILLCSTGPEGWPYGADFLRPQVSGRLLRSSTRLW